MIRLRWRLRLRRATQDGALVGEQVWRLTLGWPRLPELGERWRDVATCVGAVLLACAPWFFAAVASADTATGDSDPRYPTAQELPVLMEEDAVKVHEDHAPEPIPVPAPIAAPAAPSVAPSATVTAQGVVYEVPFSTGSADITSRGEAILARVADTMHYYPLDRLHVVGYASDDEGDDMAESRAQAARTGLIERYHLSESNISVASRPTGNHPPMVEVYIVEGVR